MTNTTLNFIDSIKERAKKYPKTIVFPEATDKRMLKAAQTIQEEGFCKEIILLGDESIINNIAKDICVSLDGITIHNHLISEKRTAYAELYRSLPKGKNATQEEALDLLKNPLYYGACMVKAKEADSFVAGAATTTSDVLKASIFIIGKKEKSSVVSGCFIMVIPDCEHGENGILAFADSGVIPEPNARQLAAIAASTAETFGYLTGCAPKVAMLSFSSKGSSQHKSTLKVIEATKIAKENNPDLLIDGEMQADVALIASVGKRKMPDSTIAGEANVLIFPNLNSGNIAYKLTERLARAQAYGPLIQGTSIPISDLSRGCSTEDIVSVTAITAVRAQHS